MIIISHSAFAFLLVIVCCSTMLSSLLSNAFLLNTFQSYYFNRGYCVNMACYRGTALGKQELLIVNTFFIRAYKLWVGVDCLQKRSCCAFSPIFLLIVLYFWNIKIKLFLLPKQLVLNFASLFVKFFHSMGWHMTTS